MTQQAYRINSRVATSEREYLIQTVNDPQRSRVLSSIFSDGELLDTFEEQIETNIQAEELKRLGSSTHEDRKREMEQLVEMYREAAGIEDPRALDYLGQALFFKRMYLEAIRLFERAAALEPQFHEGWSHLGQVQFAINRFSEACNAFGKAVELKPGFADYRNQLGEAFLAMESCKRAVIEFDEALKINIYYGEAYLNQALAFILNALRREDFNLFTNQTELTRKALDKAAVIMPDIADDDFLEGNRLFEQGDLEKAFAKFLTCREKRRRMKYSEASNFYLKFMLGADRLNEKIITRRIKYLQNAISDNPHYADLHYELALAYTLLARFINGKATEEYKKALSINPDFERARKNLRLAENELKGVELLIKAIMKG